MQIQPYVFFDGHCDEAIAFYKNAIGAEVLMLMRFKDSPDLTPGSVPPGSENNVLHAALRVGQSTLFVSDGRGGGNPKFEGISLSLAADNDADAKRLFEALAQGGTIHVPIGKSFFSSSFGMVADRFGVLWMVTVPCGTGRLIFPLVFAN